MNASDGNDSGIYTFNAVRNSFSMQSIKDDKSKCNMRDSEQVLDPSIDSINYLDRHHNEKMIDFEEKNAYYQYINESRSSVSSSCERNSTSESSDFIKSNNPIDFVNDGNDDSRDILQNYKVNFLLNGKKLLKNINSLDDLTNKTSRTVTTLEEKPVKPVKNIDDLKKVLSRVKVVTGEISSCDEVNTGNFSNKILNENKTPLSAHSKFQLENYCRTCAGLKIPLVDIFGEKGIQMRLNQQMRHLEHISKDDSLSTQICMDCICDLKMSYKFFMQIKKAEVKLKSIRASLNSVSARQADLKSDELINSKKSQEREEIIKCPIQINKRESSRIIISSSDESTNNHCANSIDNLMEHKEKNKYNENDFIEKFDLDNSILSTETCDKSHFDMEIDTNLDNVLQENRADMYSKETAFPIKDELCEKNNEESKDITDKSIYQYNSELKTYIKLESDKSVVSNMLIQPNPDILESENDALSKEKNLLKKNISLDALNNVALSGKESKIDQFDTVIAPPAEEEGIMYVTVKGSKPNELLLVKVKKMHKNGDRKGGNHLNKNMADVKFAEKFSKTLSYKDIYNNRTKEIENRGAIIEEQIEEYKKKREKFLGVVSCSNNNAISTGNVNNSININSFDREESSSDKIQRSILIESIDSNKTNDKLMDDKEVEELHFLDTDQNKNTNEVKRENTQEYLTTLVNVNQKCEMSNSKNQPLKKELTDSIEKGSIDKLHRILGENEKNLLEFQEYLKQRKIVIARLNDEDIISLYEDRHATIQKKFPNLIYDNLFLNFTNEDNFLDCDYCPDIFFSQESLEEHLKTHDFKILFFCDDCGSEFSTNKAKRAHSIVCVKKLICKYCDFVSESKGKKRQHEQKHCDAIYGQLCDMCGEKFKHQGTLDQHIKTQHMSWEKIFQCPKCPKKFAFKQKLSFHVKSVHTTLRAYLCEDCGADFKNPASLRHHRIRKHQPSSNKRECQVCHKIVPFYSLSKHMYTHKAYTIKCPHCDKMFKNSSTLKQHLRIHEDQRPYRCENCGAGFNRRDGLRLHMRVHLKSNSRALRECSCQICSEKFPNHSMLVIHRNRVHKDGKQYTCHICNRSMLSSRSLEWHMSHIHNQVPPGISRDQVEPSLEKKRVLCNHCNKTFKTEMILRTHIKNTHMEKNPVKCLDCDLMFTSEVRLKHHMMIAHNRYEGTLTCPHCPKRFVNQLRLKTHMISHSEDRPYTCEICGFNLKTKIQLIKHHQNKHSDERPLQCRFCPWRCKQVSALVCHERTHTNERPYSCIVCKQRFKYLGDKNKHQRRHESLGGAGFKRIVAGRNIKQSKNQEGETSGSDQEQVEPEDEYETTVDDEQQFGEEIGHEGDQQIIKFEAVEVDEEYEQVYEQEYDEISEIASDSADVIMSIENTSVYTEEVSAENIEHEDITDQMLQPGTIVHLRQKDENGKIQVIPVMLSLPDLTESGTEVDLATASIMYNS
ncbi:uncharacterized protein LOC103572648 isoform X1 [Microplitis demolitor]|uniref:uncharacterized protein LOC103572648 isoform X1 n=2 Tax=Microplitis demolitor TaxID=69319 RepID=UPI0004CCA2D0|nr:uncharacterized protein LOC103572648 isoform X1 [Microplitis demolitor]